MLRDVALNYYSIKFGDNLTCPTSYLSEEFGQLGCRTSVMSDM